jgi:stearoyl-CoA desaturase (Delta-9 desaturase)
MLGQGILYMFVLAPLINGLGHWRGAQNFRNTAYNSRVLAWLTGGESLHNNHHAFPRSPKFSLRRSELDPSWVAIRVLAAMRLIVVVGAPLKARPTR